MSDLKLKPDPGLDQNTDPNLDCKPNSDPIYDAGQNLNPKANPVPEPTHKTEPNIKLTLP